MAEVDTEEEAMEEDILPKFAVIVKRQGIPLIHAIKSMVFHLISSLKIRTMIIGILMQFFRIQILIMSSKSEVESQQIGFILDQYQTLLAILQQTKSNDNVSNQVSVIPFNMSTQTGNNFISSFSSWIIDSGATNHICSSLTFLLHIIKLILFMSNYQV